MFHLHRGYGRYSFKRSAARRVAAPNTLPPLLFVSFNNDNWQANIPQATVTHHGSRLLRFGCLSTAVRHL